MRRSTTAGWKIGEWRVQGRPDVLAAGLPLQILEKNSLNDPNKLWPGVDNFQNKFKILWGIK